MGKKRGLLGFVCTRGELNWRRAQFGGRSRVERHRVSSLRRGVGKEVRRP